MEEMADALLKALEELTTVESPVRHGAPPSPTASAAIRIVVDSLTHVTLEVIHANKG